TLCWPKRLDTLRVASNTPRFGIERCQIARLWPYKQLGRLILPRRLRRLLSPTPTPTATTTPTATATATFTATPAATATFSPSTFSIHIVELNSRLDVAAQI